VRIRTLAIECKKCLRVQALKRVEPLKSRSSSVASLKFRGGQILDFRLATVLCMGCRLSKHKITRYSKNSGGMAPLATPGCAYVSESEIFERSELESDILPATPQPW